LYLFLLTVADAQGLSYYAEPTLCQRLGFAPEQLARARAHLMRLELIAYRAPLTQVLALDRPPPQPAPLRPQPADPDQARAHLERLRQRLRGRIEL
jgi:hypothetical protein